MGYYRSEGGQPKHEPSPEEIQRECLKIQSKWSPLERRKRAGIIMDADVIPRAADFIVYLARRQSKVRNS